MPKPFVVPEGVVFLVEDDGVTIENQGDVVLHTDFGGRLLKRIVSREGDVELHASVTGGLVSAGGSVRFGGNATAEAVVAGKDVSVAGTANLASVTAGGTLHLAGNATLGPTRVGGDLSVDGALTAGPVEAGGGLVVGGAATLADVTAGGTITLLGPAKAGTLRAPELNVRGGSLTARGVQGSKRVAIGPAQITVDAVIAPEVSLDPKTSGRVTVIESQNELGPNALKGCFRLADYAGLVGDPAAFLADRGLVPLGEAVAAPSAVEPQVAPATPASTREADPAPVAHAPEAPEADADADEAPAPVDEGTEPEGEGAAEAAPTEAPEAEADADSGGGVARVQLESAGVADAGASEAEAAEPAEAPDEEPEVVEAAEVDVVDDEPAPSAAVVEVDNDPVSEPAAVAIPGHADAEAPQGMGGEAEHPMHNQLVDTVQRIADCYAGQELPPAVEKLQELIDTRSYTRVRSEITNIWSELLKFHQKKGLRIQHQVTTTFNSVNSMVKKM